MTHFGTAEWIMDQLCQDLVSLAADHERRASEVRDFLALVQKGRETGENFATPVFLDNVTRVAMDSTRTNAFQTVPSLVRHAAEIARPNITPEQREILDAVDRANAVKGGEQS